MGRRQCKNSSNILKSNMATPESSGHTTRRLDHPNPEEVEGNNSKCNFMKIMETFKEEVRNSLKEMEDKTNKKLEEINKSLKDTHENQEKAIKQVKEIVQDLKTEMEVIKKILSEGRLDMQNLSK
ncbi:LINE-1 retrotransposable element ORF1 protein [Lemmus lemmus]